MKNRQSLLETQTPPFPSPYILLTGVYLLRDNQILSKNGSPVAHSSPVAGQLQERFHTVTTLLLSRYRLPQRAR